MRFVVRRGILGAVCFVLVGAADAQNLPPILGGAAPVATAAVEAPVVGSPRRLSEEELGLLRQGIDAAQAGDIGRARELRLDIADSTARKLVLWAMADAAPERLSFFELDQARRDLWGWPRAGKRQAAAERQIENQAMAPGAVIDWFKGEEPSTAEGAMALAAAYRAVGRGADAQALVKHVWRDKVFEVEPQRQMLARFPDYLTAEDHVRRADMLLYGQQGPAAREMIALLPSDQQAVAQARIAFRSGSSRAEVQMEQLPASLQDDPGLTFEHTRWLRRQGQGPSALGLLRNLPKVVPGEEAGAAIWLERRALVAVAMNARDYNAAYAAAANNGLPPGVDYAEAEFFAGWIALTKLRRPDLADQHFYHIQQVGSSPITQSRALYWRGRAAEAGGDPIGAKDFYAQANLYPTTFYGQLAGERSGRTEFAIGHDPVPTAADRARFEGRDTVQAARLLADCGETDLFKSFVLSIDDTLPNAEEYVLLVDLARLYGQQDLSMRVVRVAAQHGFILPDRGYPVMSQSSSHGSAELALVLSIARQESNFDPRARSAPGARGMMQLMPATAATIARRMGESYSADRLYDPDYNVRLGSAYLGSMVDNFGGSYVMATASYNAGPNHMPEWSSICGDPRSTSGDPIDFIECIPFSETRNYVMRVMESMEVYRARLNGGHAALTLSQDLKRGGYVPGATPYVALNAPPAPAIAGSSAPGTMAPIPD